MNRKIEAILRALDEVGAQIAEARENHADAPDRQEALADIEAGLNTIREKLDRLQTGKSASDL